MNKIRTFQDIISALGEGRRLTNIDLKFGGHDYNYIYAKKIFNNANVNIYEKKDENRFGFASDMMFSFDENYWKIKQYKLNEILEEFNMLNRKYIHSETRTDKVKQFINKIGRLSWDKSKYIDIYNFDDKIYSLTFEDLFIANDWEVIGANYRKEFNIWKLFNISEDRPVKRSEDNESSEI